MSEDRQWTQAKEEMSPAIRWTEAADPNEKNPTVFVGSVVQGIYVARKDGIGANDSSIYTIELADGRRVGVWSTTVLKGKMELVPMGSEVRITLNGFKKSKIGGRKPWGDFTVEFAKPVTTMQSVGEGTAKAAAPTVPAQKSLDEEF